MDYIRYHETETLFIKWPLLKAIRESSLLELKAVGAKESIGTDEEYIYSLIVGNKVMNDMPFATTNDISNPTEKIAINYTKIIQNNISNTEKEIKEELLQLWLIDGKLDIGYKSLSPLKQKILELYYWDKHTWDETIQALKKDNNYCSKSQVQKYRKEAIEKIKRISKITIEMYNDIMKIIEGHYI